MSTEAMKRARDALGLYARTLAPTETQKKGMDAITALDKALAQPQQEPVAWVTVEKGVCATTRSANFSRIPDGQYQLYVGPLKNDVVAAITTLKALGYVYNKSKTCKEGEQWVAPQPAQRKPLTDEEIENIAAQTLFPIDFARTIEAAHGIKENS